MSEKAKAMMDRLKNSSTSEGNGNSGVKVSFTYNLNNKTLLFAFRGNKFDFNHRRNDNQDYENTRVD